MRLTIIQAADRLGVSVPTVRRMIVQGKLPATRFDGPHGSRWEIAPESLEGLRPKWLIKVEQAPERVEALHHEAVNQGPEVVEAVESLLQPEAVDHGGAALLAALQAAARADQRLEFYRERAEAAQQQALAAERARMALEFQLGQYQRALSEQADSLAAERAGRQAAEAWRLAAEAAVVPAVETKHPSFEDLKTGTPTAKRGWGQRLGRWLLGQQTG